MDIKEIAEQVSKRIYVEDGLLLSRFISEKFAEALVESYKAELLKEAGEPTCWMTPDGEGWRMRTKPPETDTKLGWMEFYTSDQLAAAIIKATGPLEEEVERNATRRYELVACRKERDELRAKLAKAEQLWQVAQGRCDGLEEKLAAAQEEIERWKNGGYTNLWKQRTEDRDETIERQRLTLLELRDQLAKAEQRVAEAISAMCNKSIAPWEQRRHGRTEAEDKVIEIIEGIEAGEWRKFVKEEV